jgi:AcrR family transcriptional regulator
MPKKQPASPPTRVDRASNPADEPPLPKTLRERKKARTRQEFIDAAFALFAERGFDDVTVDEIVDAADISRRTFFRYFPVKEDIALAGLAHNMNLLVETFSGRPPEEEPLRALREAARPPIERIIAQPRVCEVVRMMSSSPSLQAREASIRAATEDAITRQLGARMGVDPDKDMRPRLIAVTVLAGLVLSIRQWAEEGGRGDLGARVDQVFALLGGGLGNVS